MHVVITAGVFGHNANGRIIPIQMGEVVEVDDALGRRLVKQGVAEEVELEIPTKNADVEPDAEPDAELDADPYEETVEAAIPEYSKDMTRLELEEIGAEMGLHPEDLKNAPNKAALIALLDEAKAEFELDELPDLNAAEAIK